MLRLVPSWMSLSLHLRWKKEGSTRLLYMLFLVCNFYRVPFDYLGTILLDLLLLPGLSMIAGGLKYQQQKFNPVAAGSRCSAISTYNLRCWLHLSLYLSCRSVYAHPVLLHVWRVSRNLRSLSFPTERDQFYARYLFRLPHNSWPREYIIWSPLSKQ